MVGPDITVVVFDFFTHKKLLKEINSTVITLIPKIKCPSSVTDFRPISCCNTLYKMITKLICRRLRAIFPDIET